MGIWGRSRVAREEPAYEPEYLSYGPLYDEDGPGDPEFGAWLDQKLGLKGEVRAEEPPQPMRRTRGWCRHMKASIKITPWRRHPAAI